jgi:beta-mannosidase
MKFLPALLFPLLLFLHCTSSQPASMSVYKQTLSEGWRFRQASDTIWRPATVPGTVHTDLLQNGVIEDPFYRTNERGLQWIDKADWEYATTFEASAETMQKERIVLLFKGLDTYADVYLNDSLLLRAGNFFRSWEADAKPFLKAGKNELRVFFHSPIKIGLEKLQAHGYPLPASNDQSENGGMGDKRVSIFTRKPGYHYGWDWGPRLVSSGIWQPAKLLAWNDLRITGLYFQQISLTPENALLKARFEVEATKEGQAAFQIVHEGKVLAELEHALTPGRQEVQVDFEIPNPKLWWTRELGEPYLYELSGKAGGDEKTHAIGLRNLRIVQEPAKQGTSFYVELNGIPIFSKGANYIPNDVFIPRVTDEQYENLIASAVAANMNMLRVWGGGFYEKDIFYELCDRNGILVWQDFMFACAMYPGDAAFLENVRLEAEENVRRLRNHPSIALWCGNNEIDVAWANFNEKRGWGWKQLYSPAQRKEIWAAYDTVFHKILPAAVETHAPGVFYWPSSPYMGPGQHAAYSGTAGDTHYWGVWHGEEPFSKFRDNLSPFVSEYGFQSFPELNTVKKYTLPEDWDIESEVMAAHQRSGIGNLRIRSYMEQHYKVPGRFEDLLYVGQLLQADAIRQAIEAHRIAMPFCMGSLYWQINDCWPVASWSGMDYYQNWKAMHYAVKKAFEPLLVAAQADSTGICIYGVSDLGTAQAATLYMELLNFEGRQMAEWTREVELPARTSTRLDTFPVEELSKLSSLTNAVLHIRLLQGEEELSDALVYFAPPKALELPAEPGLAWTMTRKGDGFDVALSAEKLAKNVYLYWEGAEGFFSDNYFDLLPGEEKTIHFKPRPSGGGLKSDGLIVRTLADTR